MLQTSQRSAVAFGWGDEESPLNSWKGFRMLVRHRQQWKCLRCVQRREQGRRGKKFNVLEE